MTEDGELTAKSGFTAEERRDFVRIRKEIQVTCTILSAPKEEMAGETRDLGAGGVLLSTRRPLTPGVMLLLHVVLDADALAFDVKGRVVRTGFNATLGRHESGVCFVGLDPGQRLNVLAVMGRHGHSGEERRKYIRLQRRLLAEYRTAHKLFGSWHIAHTQDLSLGGAMLLTDEHLFPSHEVDVRIGLDDGSAKPLIAAAVVIDSLPSKEQRGVQLTNVRFMKDDAQARERLMGYICRLLGARTVTAGAAPRADAANIETPPA